MGKTLREIVGIGTSKKDNIAIILGSKRIKIFFDNNPGEIVVQYDCVHDKGKNFINGLFAGGVAIEIKRRHLWLSSLHHAIGLDSIYDVYVVGEKEEDISKDLKIFNFRGENGNTEEYTSVIHSDPFLAYLRLRKEFRYSEVVQKLTDIQPIRAGCVSNYKILHSE